MGLLLQYTLVYATVLALVAFGGMFSERSGVINLGLEGIMVIGSLCGALVAASLTDKIPNYLLVIISILASIIGGIAFSMLLGVACITFKADQTLTGTALNIMSTALAVVIARAYTKTPSSQIGYNRFIFLFGGALNISVFTILMLIILVSSYLYLYKTKFGLDLMACGEHPQAADSVGINVYKKRYLGVGISGALGGLGGFAYVILSNSVWDFKYGVAGFGFLALAVMIFGQWKPIRIFVAAIIFGFFKTIGVLYQGALGIPSVVYKILPYVISMIVLAFSSKYSHAPKAEGIPYDKGGR